MVGVFWFMGITVFFKRFFVEFDRRLGGVGLSKVK